MTAHSYSCLCVGTDPEEKGGGGGGAWGLEPPSLAQV